MSKVCGYAAAATTVATVDSHTGGGEWVGVEGDCGDASKGAPAMRTG